MRTYQPRFLTWASEKAVSQEKQLGFPVLFLGLLITSYFYCLPIGRYGVGSVETDFRIYDFVFFAFMILIGLGKLKELRLLWEQRDGFFRWAVFLLYLVGMSLGITLFASPSTPEQLLYTMLRAIRFTNYLLIGAFIIIFTDTPYRYRFLFGVIYINIVIQAFLAFAQGVGWMGTFWPDYWTVRFGKLPVGTLSPHHLQIAIVMLLGIGLTMALIYYLRDPFIRIGLVILLGVMMAVTVFSGTRTAWVAAIGIVILYFYLYRGKGVQAMGLTIPIIFLLLLFNRNLVLGPLQKQINNRLTVKVEAQGVEGVYGDRETVTRDIVNGMQTRPWVMITGIGFQNANTAISNSGAHNNYLQAWVELGIPGFIVYLTFLINIWRKLRLAITQAPGDLEKIIAQGAWMAFGAVLISMWANETLWAQYSMFTLTGQIMAVMALGMVPLYWAKPLNSTAPTVRSVQGHRVQAADSEAR